GSFYPQFIKKGIVLPHQLETERKPSAPLPGFFNLVKFNIVHSGNLLWGRDPIGLIKGFIKFLHKTPQAGNDARLLFLGGENHYSQLLKEYEDKSDEIFVTPDYL